MRKLFYYFARRLFSSRHVIVDPPLPSVDRLGGRQKVRRELQSRVDVEDIVWLGNSTVRFVERGNHGYKRVYTLKYMSFGYWEITYELTGPRHDLPSLSTVMEAAIVDLDDPTPPAQSSCTEDDAFLLSSS